MPSGESATNAPNLDEPAFNALAMATRQFPPSLEHAPHVARAAEAALQRFKAGEGSLHDLVPEEARIQMASIMRTVKDMSDELGGRNRGFAGVADAVPSEVFLSLLRSKAPFDQSRGSFEAWMKGVVAMSALRLASQEAKKRARTTYVPDLQIFPAREEGPEDDTEPLPPLEELHKRLRERLADDRERHIFDLKYVKNLTTEQIMAELDLKKDAVYKRLERVRKRLEPFAGEFFNFDLT